VPKQLIGTSTLNFLKFVHILISFIIFYKLCSMAISKHPKLLPLKNHVRIVPFDNVTGFLYHSSTTQFILSLIFIKGLIRALRPYTYVGIVISLVIAMARKFMHDRTTYLYLGLKRVTILVSTKQPCNIHAVIPIMN